MFIVSNSRKNIGGKTYSVWVGCRHRPGSIFQIQAQGVAEDSCPIRPLSDRKNVAASAADKGFRTLSASIVPYDVYLFKVCYIKINKAPHLSPLRIMLVGISLAILFLLKNPEKGTVWASVTDRICLGGQQQLNAPTIPVPCR